MFSQPRDGSLDSRQGPEQPLAGSQRSGQVEVVIQEHDSDSDSYDEKGDTPDEVGEKLEGEEDHDPDDKERK